MLEKGRRKMPKYPRLFRLITAAANLAFYPTAALFLLSLLLGAMPLATWLFGACFVTGAPWLGVKIGQAKMRQLGFLD